MIAVVDYGAGNVQSVVNALHAIGADAHLTSEASVVRSASGVIVPGVGAARDTMQNLSAAGLVEPVRDVIERDVPYLGICMGMQALMTYSEEHGGPRCLDVIPGAARLIETELQVPHMGWNGVERTQTGTDHPLFDGLPDGAELYFAHSFVCEPDDPTWVLAETDYGARFACAVGRSNVMGVQFHPEKSGPYGLKLLRNFVTIVNRGGVEKARSMRAGAA